MASIPSNPEAGRLQVWRVMSALQKHYGQFTYRALVDILPDDQKKNADHYLTFLLAERVIVPSGPAGLQNRSYCIVNAGEAPPLRAGDSTAGQRQQALWTAMRALGSFRSSELVVAASTDQNPMPRGTVSSYVAELRDFGYIQIAGQAPERNQTLIYRLAPSRNTGPKAPIILRRQRACFDLNLMCTVNLNGPREKAA